MVAVESELPRSVSPSADAIPRALRRSGGSPRQVLAASLVGTVVLALFASRDLPSWAERLGDGPAAHTAQHLAADWDRAMAGLGLVRPHEALRRAIGQLRDWQWSR